MASKVTIEKGKGYRKLSNLPPNVIYTRGKGAVQRFGVKIRFHGLPLLINTVEAHLALPSRAINLMHRL